MGKKDKKQEPSCRVDRLLDLSKKTVKRHCNLCGRKFKARNRFIRFCDVCKGRSEVYRFADAGRF